MESVEEQKMNLNANQFRHKSLVNKSVKAFKLFTYRKRVEKYIKGKQLITKYGPLFFEAFRDKYYEKKVAKLKNVKAINFNIQRLTFNALLQLHQYANCKKLKTIKAKRASI